MSRPTVEEYNALVAAGQKLLNDYHKLWMEHVKLRAVVEAAREVVRDPYPDEIERLAGTLKALEENN